MNLPTNRANRARHGLVRLFALILFVVPVAACDEGSGEGPYLEFVGGGFIFNYNVIEAYYGFVARVVRRPPEGAIIEARFEDPSGGPPLIVRQPAQSGRIEYSFRSPSLHGVKANRDYVVELRVLDGTTEAVLGTLSKAFQSSADQSVLD